MSWRCKSCNREMPVTPAGIAGVIVKNRCRCGKIRARERAKGCSKCGAHTIEITIAKRWYGWRLDCQCGHSWRVRQ